MISSALTPHVFVVPPTNNKISRGEGWGCRGFYVLYPTESHAVRIINYTLIGYPKEGCSIISESASIADDVSGGSHCREIDVRYLATQWIINVHLIVGANDEEGLFTPSLLVNDEFFAVDSMNGGISDKARIGVNVFYEFVCPSIIYFQCIARGWMRQ